MRRLRGREGDSGVRIAPILQFNWPGMQPHAHRGRERDFGLEDKAHVAEALLEFESHPHGPLGMILAPCRPAENGEKSI